MQRCRINPTYLCGTQFNTEKGAWNYLHSCENCVIFIRSQQRTLLETNPNYKVACPKCGYTFKYYRTVTGIYKCKKCGSFVKEKELILVCP